jgi:hypothetical protein
VSPGLLLAALRCARMCREHGSVSVVMPACLRPILEPEVGMRFVGIDVHRDFCQLAIADGGRVRWRACWRPGSWMVWAPMGPPGLGGV